MIVQTLTVKEPYGIHARPASRIAAACRQLDSRVTLVKNEKRADGRSVLQLLLLAAEEGAQIEVMVDGGNETAVMEQIVELFEHGAGI
jgi:phosphocarrier protein